ncbi:MAG: hypothetical protein ACP5NS_00325 [Candidatus Pacearchaeota archaeon]
MRVNLADIRKAAQGIEAVLAREINVLTSPTILVPAEGGDYICLSKKRGTRGVKVSMAYISRTKGPILEIGQEGGPNGCSIEFKCEARLGSYIHEEPDYEGNITHRMASKDIEGELRVLKTKISHYEMSHA